jgi:hypothetical protein
MTSAAVSSTHPWAADPNGPALDLRQGNRRGFRNAP